MSRHGTKRTGGRKGEAPRRTATQRVEAENKRPAGAAPGEPPARRAWDGFVSFFLGRQGATEFTGAGLWQRAGITADPALLTTLYRESWLAKRIIDMPSEDMTRAWYSLSASVGKAEAEALKRLEARHEIRREITNAIRWARLYGGACALMVLRGQERCLDRPLDPDSILPGDFRGLLIRDRISGVIPGPETETDLDDPDFGYPMYYDFETEELGILRVHHSRVLRFIGRDLPGREEIAEQFWGASELEHIWEELQKRTATSMNIARLVFQANITTLKMQDFGDTLAFGTEEQRHQILSAMEEQNRMRDSFGLQILSSGDTYENHPYSFSGLSAVYEAFMMDMAGAAGIPATRLFGRSPQGMNATGESDLKNYYEMIGEMQEKHLRPALEKLLPVMALSLWGETLPRGALIFPSLMPAAPLEQAEIRARDMDTLTKAVSAGLLTPAEAREKLRQDGWI